MAREGFGVMHVGGSDPPPPSPPLPLTATRRSGWTGGTGWHPESTWRLAPPHVAATAPRLMLGPFVPLAVVVRIG